MSDISYNAGTMTVTVAGLDDVSRALGNLKNKTPAAAKVAINATARETRKLMVAQAKARYAVNTAGRRHLKDLVQRKKATNSSLSAELHIRSFRNELANFQHRPTTPFPGRSVAMAPEYFRGHVLKGTPMQKLKGGTNEAGLHVSKGFLAHFKSGHVGMVQRIIGSRSDSTVTARVYPRWRKKIGQVEKLVTMGSPSAAAMHRTIWPYVEPSVEDYLQERLALQVEKVLERAANKQKVK